MTINPAPDRLLDLAAEMRPGWDRDELSHAFVAAKLARWSWTRTFMATARLLCDPKAFPHHLAAAARNPFDKQAGDEPSPEWRERKAALEHNGGTE